MRVALVAESYLPARNGVTRSVVEVAQYLANRHDVAVVAPAHPDAVVGPGDRLSLQVPVRRVPSVRLPGYRELTVGLPGRSVDRVLEHIAPDVLYVAAPVVLGHRALEWACRAGVPAIAVHQTDLAGFAPHYHVHGARRLIERRLRSTYLRAHRVLAPSRASSEALRRAGVPRVHLWARGVDLTAFSPSWRCDVLRAHWRGRAHSGDVVIGYCGRLAAEKRLDLLVGLDSIPGARLVVVGDGPERLRVHRLLPGAVFAGHLRGEALSRAVASFDMFVHAGTAETFGQAIQEALAAQVPVVAPDIGGPRDLVQHDVNGMLYRPGRRDDLYDTVRRLCDDPERLVALRARTRASVGARSWTTVCAELDRHLREVAGVGHEPQDVRTAA